MLPGTAAAWVETLTAGKLWDEQADRERIREAFVTLARTAKNWPGPAHFLEVLRPRQVGMPALPAKPNDPEKSRAILAEINRTLRNA